MPQLCQTLYTPSCHDSGAWCAHRYGLRDAAPTGEWAEEDDFRAAAAAHNFEVRADGFAGVILKRLGHGARQTACVRKLVHCWLRTRSMARSLLDILTVGMQIDYAHVRACVVHAHRFIGCVCTQNGSATLLVPVYRGYFRTRQAVTEHSQQTVLRAMTLACTICMLRPFLAK